MNLRHRIGAAMAQILMTVFVVGVEIAQTLTGLVAFLLVTYGPKSCFDTSARFGSWCVSHCGDWVYRKDRRENFI